GHTPVVYSRSANYSLLPDLRSQIPHAPGDVQDLPALSEALQRFKIRRIIHLAAALGSSLEQDPPHGYRVNVLGGLNVFDAARANGVERVVFTSSKAVYGSLRGDHAAPAFKPVTEDYVGQTTGVY